MLTTTIDTEKVMHQTIFAYLSENVWNTPLLECRRNIVPMSLNNGRAAVNTVDLGCQSVDLPYSTNIKKKSFYLYAAAKCCMGGLVVDTEVPSIKDNLSEQYNSGWIPLDVYLNHRPFDLRIHGINGEWLYRHDIWIKNHPYQDMFLIAVEVGMAKQILGKKYDFKTIFMSVYYDSDNDLNSLSSTSKTISCFHPEGEDIDTLNEAYQAYASLSSEIPPGRTVSERGQTMCFIDGRESTPASLSDIKIGQYIEVVQDPDIICNIVLDLTKIGNNNIYRSTIDDTYKYIIHIPKSVNPENFIISHNTCDLFIRPINTHVSSDERLKGLFVHRFNTSKRLANNQLIDDMITQITHNDFGVSEKLLMSRMENGVLGTTECVLRAVIRRHSKTKVLSEDANFIKLLYNFNNDEQILKILTGNEDKSLWFWSAENLEHSNYSKMIVNFPILTSSDDTSYYMNALGYFNSLCILTPRTMRRMISDINTRNFDVSIPISIQSCEDIGLVVYLNGEKVSDDYVSYSDEYQYIHVTINESVPFHVGDQITFELFDADPLYGEYFTPTAEDPTFWIQDGVDFDLYMVEDEPAVDDYYTSHYPAQHQESFIKIENTSTSSDVMFKNEDVISGNPIFKQERFVKNGVSVDVQKAGYVFTPSYFGKKFFFCSKIVFKRFTASDIAGVGGNTTFGGVAYSNGTCTDLMHSGFLKLKALQFKTNMVPTTDTHVVDDRHYYICEEIVVRSKTIKVYTLSTPITNDNGNIVGTYYVESHNEVSIPIINKEWNSIVFMNNKELVRDIDYTFLPIVSQQGIKGMVWFFNNISYLKSENNTFEVYLTSDKAVSNFSGFMHNRYTYIPSESRKEFVQGVVEEVVPYIYWFDRLCIAAIDGECRPDLKQSNGYLKVSEECRQGGLYYTRGMIPVETQKYVNKYLSIEDDLVKLAAIAEYRKKNSPHIPPEIEVIPYSHHIASITMNAVAKDVLTRNKVLAYESDPVMMLRQLTEYESLKKYDAAMYGVAKEISISGAGYTPINNVYKLVDASMSGHNRRWVNNTNNVVIYCKYDLTTNTYRWEIATFNMLGKTVYYYADDPTGTNDPWELTWKCILNEDGLPIDGNGTIPKIESGSIDLRYLDLFPSYSSDLHFVVDDVVLKQAMRALFPIDDVTDGDTVP